jgi:hypothetical protein
MTAAHESSWMRRVWRDWRPEVLRGAFLFLVVAAVGIFFLRQVRAFEPLSLLRDHGIDVSAAGDADRNWVNAFRWSDVLAADGPVWIRNLNGAITVERAAGDSVIVIAQKSWKHGDPESVHIVTVPSDGSVTVCALWTATTAECGPGGAYHMKGGKGSHGDVAVRFIVQIPEGVRLDASTINGSVSATGTTAPLTLETVNGGVAVTEARGAVTAHTVNGSITATVLSLPAASGLDLKTVNGSIEASVPAGIDALLEASTVNGKVHTEIPIQVIGPVSPRSLRATLGAGGAALRLKTVNGSVTLVPAGAAPKAPEPTPPPARRGTAERI